MDLIIVQLLTLLGLLVTCLTFSLIPLALAWRASRPSSINNRLGSRFLGKVNSFVGGVFFATCFLHLLPEVRKDLGNNLRGYGIVTAYPVAELVTCVGFFIVHLVESLTHLCLPHDESPSRDRRSYNTVDEEGTTRPLIRGESKVDYGAVNPSAQGTGPSDSSVEVIRDDRDVGRNVHTFLLLIALSVHGTFEGVALGVQSSQSSLLSLFFVVVVHKSILALSLGMNVATGDLSLPYKVITCVVFSLAGPVGQGIGLLVTNADGGGLVTGILQGVAAGTLLHVTFMEVLSKDMKTSDMLSTLSAVIGFALIAGLTLLD
ncbi:zinc transporter ZIP3-like [Branchiostoma floridae]|uniref:Zinc transporter ZIP3 n=1 Tax=Branchiostoma floridae TaxID=7739 RepID=A0A9J7L4W4_BRAFL|nr:zinc transporter ZIP3-like [Branchiostoma floridae]